MACAIAVPRIRRRTGGLRFAALLPVAVAVAVLAGRPTTAAADPPWQSLVDSIATGSATPGVTDVSTGSSGSGTALSLGSSSISTGSADNAIGSNAGSPRTVDGFDTGSAESRLPATGGAEPETTTTPVGSVEALGLNQGSVELACSGSAAVGAAGILVGSATGSGVGSGLIGSGSSGGSGLGSVVVGSAATGSALLTCLLLLPNSAPPAPGAPLLLSPPLVPPSRTVAEPAPAPPPAAVPVIALERPVVASPPVLPRTTTAEPASDPIPWNVLELIALLVVTVFAIRSRSSDDRSRSEG